MHQGYVFSTQHHKQWTQGLLAALCKVNNENMTSFELLTCSCGHSRMLHCIIHLLVFLPCVLVKPKSFSIEKNLTFIHCIYVNIMLSILIHELNGILYESSFRNTFLNESCAACFILSNMLERASWQLVNIRSGNHFLVIRQHTIAWTHDGLIHWFVHQNINTERSIRITWYWYFIVQMMFISPHLPFQ